MTVRELWKGHGTKLLGSFTAAVGASVAAQSQVKALLSHRGALIYDLYCTVANYLVFGAGLAILKRGYTNTKRSNEQQAKL